MFHRAIAILGLIPLSLTGCMGIGAVVWLPDSSGFVFTEAQGKRLVFASAETGERRVLVEDTGTRTIWPALSPDGRKIVVGKYFVSEDRKRSLQLIVFDRDGKEIQKTREFKLANSTSERGLQPIDLVWGHKTECVLCFDFETTVLWDLKEDRITELEGISPFPVVSNNPSHPDGSGFLAVTKRGEELLLTFFNWKGEKQQSWDETVWGPKVKDKKQPFTGAEWQKEKLLLRTVDRAVSLNVRTGASEEVPPVRNAFVTKGGQLDGAIPFGEGNTWLCLFLVEGDPIRHQVEVQGPGELRKVVLKDRVVTFLQCVVSPDRKRVAIRTVDEEILVVNTAGEIVAKTATTK